MKKPNPNYFISAILLSISLGLLVGYPSAAVNSEPGFAANDKIWFSFAAFMGLSFSIYSLMSKPLWLMTINYLTLLIASVIFFLICCLINSEPVLANAGQVIFFSIFTFGIPFWLPLIFFFWHMAACISYGSSYETNA